MTLSKTILIATALMATTQFAEANNYNCAKGQMGLGSGEWMGHSYSKKSTDPEACKAHCEATAGCTGFDLYEILQADSCRLTKNSTGFRQVGTSAVRDICTKTDALGGNGQPMAQFFGSPPTCDTGYTAVIGDISGWGSINGKGGGQVVSSTAECASLCDSEVTCASYEIGHHNGNLTCNLNTSEQANRGPYGDFAFCVKPELTATAAAVSQPTCDTGYTAVSGDISGWGSINGKGGGRVVASTGECASLCDSEVTCASYEIGHHNGNLTCNLNTSKQVNRGPYGDFAFCVKPELTKMWETCANEGENCKISGEKLVRYGADGHYFYFKTSESFTCTFRDLGHPNNPLIPRSCDISRTSTTQPEDNSGGFTLNINATREYRFLDNDLKSKLTGQGEAQDYVYFSHLVYDEQCKNSPLHPIYNQQRNRCYPTISSSNNCSAASNRYIIDPHTGSTNPSARGHVCYDESLPAR